MATHRLRNPTYWRDRVIKFPLLDVVKSATAISNPLQSPAISFERVLLDNMGFVSLSNLSIISDRPPRVTEKLEGH